MYSFQNFKKWTHLSQSSILNWSYFSGIVQWLFFVFSCQKTYYLFYLLVYISYKWTSPPCLFNYMIWGLYTYLPPYNYGWIICVSIQYIYYKVVTTSPNLLKDIAPPIRPLLHHKLFFFTITNSWISPNIKILWILQFLSPIALCLCWLFGKYLHPLYPILSSHVSKFFQSSFSSSYLK